MVSAAQGYTLHTTTTEPVVFVCPVLNISHHPHRASGSYLPWVIHCALPQQNQWFLPAQLLEKSAKLVSVFKKQFKQTKKIQEVGNRKM
jgi:hypothetical protein